MSVRNGTLNKLLVLALGLAVVASSVSAEDKQVIRKLKNCGSEATNAFGKHTEFPIINEGGGHIGLKTEEVNAEGTTERYSLVNCESRTVVRADAEFLLKDSGKQVNMRTDLFGFVDGLRDSNRLANEALFAKLAKQKGYTVVSGALPKAYSEKARRVDCGCSLFYPELMP